MFLSPAKTMRCSKSGKRNEAISPYQQVREMLLVWRREEEERRKGWQFWDGDG